jgi:hypothetical protein
MEAHEDKPSLPPPEQPEFPWRAALIVALAIALIVAAIVLYNNGQRMLGLAALGTGFAVPMIWAIVAARAATDADSTVRRFIPRIMIYLVAGTGFLGIFWWNVDRRVSLMEAGFGAFYVVAGITAMRIFDAKRPRPQLRAVVRRNPVNAGKPAAKRDPRRRQLPRK